MLIKHGDGKVLSVVDPDKDLEDMEEDLVKKAAIDKLKKNDSVIVKNNIRQEIKK